MQIARYDLVSSKATPNTPAVKIKRSEYEQRIISLFKSFSEAENKELTKTKFSLLNLIELRKECELENRNNLDLVTNLHDRGLESSELSLLVSAIEIVEKLIKKIDEIIGSIPTLTPQQLQSESFQKQLQGLEMIVTLWRTTVIHGFTGAVSFYKMLEDGLKSLEKYLELDSEILPQVASHIANRTTIWSPVPLIASEQILKVLEENNWTKFLVRGHVGGVYLVELLSTLGVEVQTKCLENISQRDTIWFSTGARVLQNAIQSDVFYSYIKSLPRFQNPRKIILIAANAVNSIFDNTKLLELMKAKNLRVINIKFKSDKILEEAWGFEAATRAYIKQLYGSMNEEIEDIKLAGMSSLIIPEGFEDLVKEVEVDADHLTWVRNPESLKDVIQAIIQTAHWNLRQD